MYMCYKSSMKIGRGLIKGRAWGKLAVCEHDFAQLLLTSCLTFSTKKKLYI